MSDARPTVALCEVAPRDGLQNEARIVSVDDKVRFIELLIAAGLREIEVTSFVSPKWVPQLADAEAVLARIPRVEGVCYSALVPNEQGLERALAANVRKVSVFTAASEGFVRKNINATIAQSIERFVPVVRRAHDAGVIVRGYVSDRVSLRRCDRAGSGARSVRALVRCWSRRTRSGRHDRSCDARRNRAHA